MEIRLSGSLRRLRQEKKVTQEALARHLGISTQAVGKWERGESYPDIGLLPELALYFGVSVDELLDVGPARIDKLLADCREESLRLLRTGDTEGNIALWERTYERLPEDSRALCGLVSALANYRVWPIPVPEAERIVHLAKRLLELSGDVNEKTIAIQTLCIVYTSLGDREQALKYADMGGELNATRLELRAFALEGEDGVRENQRYILELVRRAAQAAVNVASKGVLSLQEQLEAVTFGIRLMELLFSDGNAGFYAGELSWRWLTAALLRLRMGDGEEALRALEKCADWAEASVCAAGRLTAPMVDRLEYSPETVTKNASGNACDWRLRELASPNFDVLREREDFREILRRLEEHAELK